MKIITIVLFLISFKVYSQVEPSVTYDPVSGNYIIEYMGYVEEGQTLVREIFEPSTKISPSINSDLIELADSMLLKYNYEVVNGSSSNQRLYNFYLDINSSISQITKPNNAWYFSFFSYRPTFHWYNSKDPSGLAISNDGIPPDSAAKGFSFISSGIPTIVTAYFRGNPKIFLSFPDEPPGEIEDLLRPLVKFPNNCVVQKTIGPKNAPDPFIASAFLDTLINYTAQSYDLGWIKEEQTKTKYENYFIDAKDALVNLDTSSARTYLENVLTDVDIDSSSALSSEAYALLRYNTEYLLEQLPIAEGMRIVSISPQITIEKTKDFTLTVHGTDFTKKSEIYWDGKKKKTKFISESVLEAKIKKKDVKKEGVYKVHITEKKIGETEELEFNVYKKLPEKLIPVVNCVEELDKNKFRVWFGYENYNDGIVLLNGKENDLKPGGKHINKPIIFLPGIHEKVFSVDYKKKDKLKWELVKEKAEVHKDSPKCE